jgi:NAD(P)-dependent dehydrogenase (short-subunit alcohol dehydrogenase family)
MSALLGKVAIVTGGGRGIGREECVLLARQGASVVVNDPGSALDGSASEERPADEVASLIKKAGGRAIASYESVTSFEGAKRIVDAAVSTYGRLDALINNAGIIRDRMVFNMSEEEFDSVIAVHLKGHFNMTRWASAYWRQEAKKGEVVPRHIVNTTSAAGLIGNVGQTNYGAAKAGIAAMTRIWSMELESNGVRVNAIAPVARTRLTEATFGEIDTSAESFDLMSPANIAPIAVFLASDRSNHISGEVFSIRGGDLDRQQTWSPVKSISQDRTYTVEELAERMKELF